MNKLTLKIQSDGDISLPARLIDGELSLGELGAILIIAALAEGHASFEHPRLQQKDVVESIKKLRERGVFNVSVVDKCVNIGVNLDKAMPQSDADETDQEDLEMIESNKL